MRALRQAISPSSGHQIGHSITAPSPNPVQLAAMAMEIGRSYFRGFLSYLSRVDRRAVLVTSCVEESKCPSQINKRPLQISRCPLQMNIQIRRAYYCLRQIAAAVSADRYSYSGWSHGHVCTKKMKKKKKAKIVMSRCRV